MTTQTSQLPQRDAEDLAAAVARVDFLLSAACEKSDDSLWRAAATILRTDDAFERYREMCRRQGVLDLNLLFSLAQADLRGFAARQAVEKGAPQRLNIIKAVLKTALWPLVTGAVALMATNLVAAWKETETHRATKVFDADYERTVDIIKQLTEFQLESQSLQSRLLAEEAAGGGRLDGYRASVYFHQVDQLQDRLSRATSLLYFDRPSPARAAELAAYVEVERLRFCLKALSEEVNADAGAESWVAANAGFASIVNVNEGELGKQWSNHYRDLPPLTRPCGDVFDVSPLESLRTETIHYLFDKLGSGVFVSKTEQKDQDQKDGQ